jgi:hypothetical protein
MTARLAHDQRGAYVTPAGSTAASIDVQPMASRTSACLVLTSLGVLGMSPLGACEPVLPMFMATGGAATLGRSLYVLAAAILLKSILFAWFERSRAPGYPRSPFAAMLAGNALSTVIGGLAAACVAEIPGLPVIGILGIAMASILPARRIARIFPAINCVFSVFGVVFLMVTLVCLSLVLWGSSRCLLEDSSPLALYWLVKFAYVFGGLLCGLIITVFWEEWAIHRIMAREDSDRHRFSSLVRANLITLGVVAFYAAVMLLPQRLHAVNFLVDLITRLHLST